MKKFKKIVALALAVVTALSLTACESKSGKSGKSGKTVTINVTRACFNLANDDTAQVQKVEDAINAYIKDKINVQIKLTTIGSGEYTEKANLALQNKEINLLWTACWESTIGTNDLVSLNAVYDLTDILPGTTLYGTMAENFWDSTKFDGKLYFIPVYKDCVEGYDIMFRQDLIDKHGWDITKVNKLEDLEPMLADAKNDGLKYPFLLQKTALFYRFYMDKFDFFTGDSTSNWVAINKETNEVVDIVTTPEYKEYCTLMAKWAEAGYVSQDEANKVTTDTTTQTQDWAISWWTDVPVNDEADSRYGQDVTMQPITSRWTHRNSALGSCYCITANSSKEEAQACIDFMGLLYTDSKLADLYTFGIEGEDFNYDANHQVVQTSEKYNHSMWESANATIVTPLDKEPANKAELYGAFNESTKGSTSGTFRFNKDNVASAYAACQDVFNEYGFILECGGVATADVDAKLTAYQAALDAAGYQDVLAEFAAQYANYMK